jgi:hypothetical protein
VVAKLSAFPICISNTSSGARLLREAGPCRIAILNDPGYILGPFYYIGPLYNTPQEAAEALLLETEAAGSDAYTVARRAPRRIDVFKMADRGISPPSLKLATACIPAEATQPHSLQTGLPPS